MRINQVRQVEQKAVTCCQDTLFAVNRSMHRHGVPTIIPRWILLPLSSNAVVNIIPASPVTERQYNTMLKFGKKMNEIRWQCFADPAVMR